jgi:hypothetical protein
MADPRIQNILQRVFDRVAELMEVDRFYVALHNGERSRLDFPFAAEEGKVMETGRGAWAPRAYREKAALPDYVIEHCTPLLIEKDLERW